MKGHTDGLVGIATVRGSEIPVHVRFAISRVPEALGEVLAASGTWTSIEGASAAQPPLPGWVMPVLKRPSGWQPSTTSSKSFP